MSAIAFTTVMIVEDDESLACTIEAALAGRAEQVKVCRRASDAIARLSRLNPDVILLDVSLPDGTAFDVLREVAAIEPQPIVIAMSGSARADESFRLAQLGVRWYLPKPFTLDQLQAALSQSPLRRRRTCGRSYAISSACEPFTRSKKKSAARCWTRP